MPRRSSPNPYPPDWPAIARRRKAAEAWQCERCGRKHDLENGCMITVHHLDMHPGNVQDWNLAVLCRRCHLQIQHKVVLEQVWPFEHSEWFRWHAAGWYAWKYRGERLGREEIEQRLDELLSLERMV